MRITGVLRELIDILDNVNSTLVIVEKCRNLPLVLTRTFTHDNIIRLGDFAGKHRECVGKVMDHACEELQVLLNEVLEESSPIGSERECPWRR